MPINLRQMSQPANEPVSIDQAKLHLRIDFDTDDDLLIAYITAARQYVEKVMQRSIYNRQMRLTLDFFPVPGWQTSVGASEQAYMAWYFRALAIRLPKPAVASITAVSYRGDDGEMHTLDPSTYVADLISEPARIMPAPGFTWPYQTNYVPGSVVIDYVSGTYGDGAEVDTCPQTIKIAILLLIGHWYANREAVSDATMTNIPLGVDSLLAGETFESCYG